MKTMKRRTIQSAILCVLMLAVVLCGFAGVGTLSVSAAEAVSYVERSWDATNKVVLSETKSVTEYTEINTATAPTTWSAGWYVVTETTTVSSSIQVNGAVNLILVDGAMLTVNENIALEESTDSLAIYGQEIGTGMLTVTGRDSRYSAGIGGNNGDIIGDIVIHGGVIQAQCPSNGTAIGGGYYGNSTVIVYGGTVTATARSAGIGSASGDANINVYGGVVTATGTNSESVGIGTGDGNGSAVVNVYGGTVTANGERSGIGASRDDSTVNIYGGSVTATGTKGPGIGSNSNNDEIYTGTVNISGGTVTATGGMYGAGIGGGYRSSAAVNISGGTVTATGGADGAGIGIGYLGQAVSVNISGGSVTATGGADGAGIGSGNSGYGYTSQGGSIVIAGGNIKATGGSEDVPAIGKARQQDGDITLTDGNGNAVSLVEVTIGSMEEAAAVTALGGVSDYGLNDVSTIDTNKLYLYVTADQASALNSITAGGETYEGSVSGNIGVFGVIYSVSFDSNGGTGTMESVTGITAPSYELPTPVFTAPDGMYFAYWTVGEDTETHYAPGDQITLTAESTTVKANWVDQAYTVTLKAGNGAGDDVNGDSIAKDGSLVLPECPDSFAAPTGKKFAGWSVQVGGGEAVSMQAGESLNNVNDNITLTALWTDRYIFIQTPAAADSLTYNGEEQTLIIAGVPSEGTVQYRVNGGEWGTEVPVATNAGVYEVEYRIFVNDSESYGGGTVEVTVAKLAVTPTIEGVEDEYLAPDVSADAPVEPTVTLKADGVVIDPSNYSVSYADNTTMGTATVMVTSNPDGNYSFDDVQVQFAIIDHRHEWEYSVDPDSKNVAYATCVSESGICNVDGRVVTLTLSALNAIYDGAAHGAELTADQTFELSRWAIVYYDESGTPYFDPPVAAGTYTAEINFGNDLIMQVEYTIHKMAIELEWSNTDLTYNGALQAPTAEILTELPEGADTATIEMVGEWIDAGTYTATATEASGNYHIINPEATVTIAPYELTLIWYDTELTYNGEEQRPLAVLEVEPIAGDTVNVTVEPNVDGWAISANEYVAIASIDNGNYVLTNPTQPFTIQKQEVPLPVIDSVVYNGEMQTAGLSYSNLYTVQNEGGTDAGEYDVVLTLTDSNNYKWADTDEESVTLTFVIEKMILHPYFEEVEYNGEAQTPKVLTGAPFTLIGEASFTAVGEHDVVVKLVDAVNYAWAEPSADDETLATATFTITKRVNEWLTYPTIGDWNFGDTPSTPEYEATYGNDSVQVLYRPLGGSIEDMTEVLPTEEGQYVAIFAVEEGESYLSLWYEVPFEILPPRVTIGGWILPALHYMDTSGFISRTQPEGGYAYVRADGVLVLNNFVIDASVFEALEASEDPEVLEKLAEYAHLQYPNFSVEDSEASLIALLVDSTVLLLGENSLTGCGSAAAIGAYDSDLTLRGGALTVDSFIVANGALEVDGCRITATGILASPGALTVTSSTIEVGESGLLIAEELVLLDSTMKCPVIMVMRSATVTNSNVQTGLMQIRGEESAFGKITVRDSRILISGAIGIIANELEAENSIFVIEVSQGYAIHAAAVSMTGCDVTLKPVLSADPENATEPMVIGFSANEVMLTDCKVMAEGVMTLFYSTTSEAGTAVILNNCEILASGATGSMPLIYGSYVAVNGGKLTLNGEGLMPLIYVSAFNATDAEIDLQSGDCAINSKDIYIHNTKLTITQSETSTVLGRAIFAEDVIFVNSTVTITGGRVGIEAENLTLDNTKLDIMLRITGDTASSAPVPPTEGEETVPPAGPVYVGIKVTTFELYGTEIDITVTLPADAAGETIVSAVLPYIENLNTVITSPEGADFELDGENCMVVLRDGETVTYPKSVTISYVESEYEEDFEEEPEAREDAVIVGGVALSNGDYLDNNGNVSKEKPEGGYAHLLDGVLTLNNFTYYGVGYLYNSYYDEEYDYTNDYHAGIYSTASLTVRVEGKNRIDLCTFAGDCLTDGIAVWNGDLTLEGNGALEILTTYDGIYIQYGNLNVKNVTLTIESNEHGIYANGNVTAERATVTISTQSDDGIETYGDLTAINCEFDLTTGNVGFDIYGNVLLENCDIILNVYDDGIWVEDNAILADCTVKIHGEDDDGIYVGGNATIIDCMLTLTTDEDGIDVDGNLFMDACVAKIEARDTGIESDGDSGVSVSLSNSSLDIVSEDSAIKVYGTVEIANCTVSTETLTVAPFCDIYCIFGERVEISDSTVSLRAGIDVYLEKVYLYGISAETDVKISDSSVSIVLQDAFDTYDCYFYGIDASNVCVSSSVLTIHSSYEALCVGDVTINDSRLDVWAEETAFCAEQVFLISCEGSITSEWYNAFEASNLRMENCRLEIYSYGDIAIDVYNGVEILDGHLEIYGNGLICAEAVVLSNCGLYLENDSEMNPTIDATFVEIKGENIDITHYQIYNEVPFIGAENFQIASDLMIENLNNGGEATLGEDGFARDEDGEVIRYFQILSRPENTGNTFEEAPILIIGDKELDIGEYLDNEGNVTDTMPTGGFAYFNGYELYLKNFAYEGVGTTLTNLNGALVTAGIYSRGYLAVHLIGENRLSFTSENTVGIAVGDSNLRMLGDGSLTLTATGKGIELIGGLVVENVALSISAIDTAISADGVTLVDATVDINVMGSREVFGILANTNLSVEGSTLTVKAESQSSACEVYAILCKNNGIVSNSILTLTGKIGFKACEIELHNTDLTITATGEGAVGIDVTDLTVVDSAVAVSVSGSSSVGILAEVLLKVSGEYTLLTVSANEEARASIIGRFEMDEGLAILTPEGATLLDIGDGTYTVANADGSYAMQVVIGTVKEIVEEPTVTVGGVELSDGEYLDNDGNVSTEMPEGGYAYFKDGVLTLNGFTYLAKKYNAQIGIESKTDLTLTLIGENLISSYNQNGILVEGSLTVNGSGSLSVDTGNIGIYVENTLTVDCNLTVTAGGNALVALKSITLGELLTVSAPDGAKIQKVNRVYVFTDADGKELNALTLTWAPHDCIDGDAVDHLCDICGKEYAICTDNDLDHACDACGGEVGYHADTNGNHTCEYGCQVTIGTCEDKNTDHDCDYGCSKAYGTCEDTDKDHACDYGCGAKFGDHADVDHDHKCDHGCTVMIGTCEDKDTDHDCDYGCSKAYGTCEDQDTDHDCDYGCPKTFGTCADADRDHDCDYGCSKTFGTCEDKDTDHKCDYGCSERYGEHVAASGSHDCGYCKSTASTCKDENADHVCDVCADELGHTYTDAWKSDANLHWHECSCGKKTDVAIHTPGSAATASEAQTCTVCGYILAPATGHTSHTPADVWKNDETHHWHECTGCTTELLDKAEHNYDNACDTTCNTCGKTRTVTHAYKIEWSKDVTNHWHECSICGDKKDEAAHTPGAAATETEAQTCTVCGYIINAAKGHTTHTPDNAWMSDATHHWHACTGCATELLDKTEHSYDNDCDVDCNVCGKIRTVAHDYKTEQSSDESGHWKECAKCGNEIDKATHTFGEWTVTKVATETEAGSKSKSCACGFTVEETIPATGIHEDETTENEPTPPTTDGEDKGLGAGAIATIVIGTVVLAGAGGFAIWWFVMSKKTLAQLGSACKGVATTVGGACKGAAQKVKQLFTKK